jgi:hypothetical protein
MPSKPDYLQLEPGDDAAAVRDRLNFLRGKRVLMVWPEKGAALSRKLDIVLVQREAARLAIRLAFVSHDPQVIQYAYDLGISVFETVGESERKRWKRGRGKLFASRDFKPGEEPDAAELMPVASRVRSAALAPPRSRPLVQIGVLLLIVAIIAAVAYVVLPSAVVSITPAQERLLVEAAITADPNPAVQRVDVDNSIIPATLVQIPIEESATTQTTGIQEAQSLRAVGSIVFVNQTDQAIDIPPGTIVSTSAGTPIQFQTTQGALLAAGAGLQVEAPIEALPEYAGEIGNVAAGLINIVNGDLSTQVTVRNLSPTDGGETRTLRSVTADDQERLLFTLRQQMQAQACDEMLARITSAQIVLCDTVRIIEERADFTRYSAEIGAIADELTLQMRIVVEATAIDQVAGQQVAFARLAAQIPRGRVILPETLAYQPGVVQSIDAEGRVGFIISASGVVAAQIDPQLISERLVARTRKDAITYLEGDFDLQSDLPPQIVQSPEWMPHLPLLPFRINVRLEQLP